MPNFKGFNTIGQHKKFTLTDVDLIKRDLLNAFSIRAGTLPGRPEVGTTIWNYVFEPNDDRTLQKVEAEVRRIIDNDSRLETHDVSAVASLNNVRVYVSVSIQADASAEEFYLTFAEESNTVTIT